MEAALRHDYLPSLARTIAVDERSSCWVAIAAQKCNWIRTLDLADIEHPPVPIESQKSVQQRSRRDAVDMHTTNLNA